MKSLPGSATVVTPRSGRGNLGSNPSPAADRKSFHQRRIRFSSSRSFSCGTTIRLRMGTDPVIPRKSRRRLLKNYARAGKKEGGWGEGIFARPRFRRFFFRRRNSFISLCEIRRRNIYYFWYSIKVIEKEYP